MDTLNYLRLKALVAPIRAAGSFLLSNQAYPDDVLHIPSRDDDRTIKLHVYRASGSPVEATAGVSTSTTPSKPRVLINWHGSGFITPAHGSDDFFCRHIADETGYVVLDAAYRLAPEHPFPAAFHDVEDVITWVLKHPEDYDTTRLALSGFSAGGCLALAAAASRPKDTIRSVLAFYPVTNLAIPTHEKTAPDPSGRSIPSYVADIFNACYLFGGTAADDPRVSPSFAMPERYPRDMLVVTAACDTLAEEAEELAANVQKVGGKNVVSKRMEGCSHAFDKGEPAAGSPARIGRDEAYRLAVELLRRE